MHVCFVGKRKAQELGQFALCYCVYGGGGGYLCVCVCVWKDTLIEVCLSTCCPDNMNPPIKLAAIVTDYRST